MRLWSLHPRHLDPAGLVALWREALLAQKVLAGETRGYRQHPQLSRFRDLPQPLEAIGCYLDGVLQESQARGYRFDAGRILAPGNDIRMTVTCGQMRFERAHLQAKLDQRAPQWAQRLRGHVSLTAHPMFEIIPGGREAWERAPGA